MSFDILSKKKNPTLSDVVTEACKKTYLKKKVTVVL